MIDTTTLSDLSLNQTGLSQLGLGTTTGTGTATATSAVTAATQTAATDQYESSEQSLFISEYQKLSDAEKEDVQNYLNELAAVKNAGGDMSDVTTEMPDFIANMISQGIGDETAALNSDYTTTVQTSTVEEEENETTLASGRGLVQVEEEDHSSATAQEAEISSGEIKVLLNTLGTDDAASNAPAELQELARKAGKDLDALLEKYLDAGATEETAYAQATAELRAQAGSESDDAEGSEE